MLTREQLQFASTWVELVWLKGVETAMTEPEKLATQLEKTIDKVEEAYIATVI